MKYFVNFSRVLIGLLFILSGLIKLNDPTGFSYKLDEYFTVFADDVSPEQDSVISQIEFFEASEKITTHLSKSDKQINFTITQDKWSQVISAESDTTYKSKVDVILNGNVVFTNTIERKDSNWDAQPLSIISNIGETNVIDKNIDITLPAIETTAVEGKVESFIKKDTWAVNLFNWLKEYALFMAIFVSWLEAILGFAILIGWQRNFTIWMLILITVFFAFLTLYSWIYNKVTDCGCFGDALPMNPEESFYKNVVIGVFILLLYIGRKHIKPIFSNSFGVKVLTVVTLLLVGFSLYCKHYLPVVDFLHYSEGTDIRAGMKVPEGERASAHVQTTYAYKAKDGSGEIVEVLYDSDKNTFEPKIDYSKYAYDKIISEKVIEDAYVPPIHDFAFYDKDQNSNYIEDFWKEKDKLLVVMHDVTKANPKAMKQINEIAKQWKEDGREFWALTASSKEEVEKFRHDNQISEFDFYYGDNTNLKSIIRSNPGLLLITDTSVVEKVWPSTRLPKYKKIVKKLE